MCRFGFVEGERGDDLFFHSDNAENANMMVAAMNNQAVILYDWARFDRVHDLYQSLMELMMASEDGRALPMDTPVLDAKCECHRVTAEDDGHIK